MTGATQGGHAGTIMPRAVERWSDAASFRALAQGAEIRSIIVAKLDHIGDFILGFDALLCLREMFPAARIDLVCAPWNRKLAESLGIFGEIFEYAFFAARADGAHPRFDAAREIPWAGRDWDLAIDLRVDPDTRMILRHINARYKAGFEAHGHNALLTLALPHGLPAGYNQNIGIHQSLLMLRLARSVGDVFARADRVPALIRDRIAQDCGIDLSAARDRFLVVCNTSSGRAVKNWPFDRFKRVIGWLTADLGAAVLLVGGADQAGEAEEIMRDCGRDLVISAVGRTTMREAIGLIGQASLYLGNDSGLTHIAARLDIPTVVLFSGIDPTAMWAPVGARVTVLKAPVACSPCHISAMEDCRSLHACLLNIPVSAVQSAIRRYLFDAPRYSDMAPAAPDADFAGEGWMEDGSNGPVADGDARLIRRIALDGAGGGVEIAAETRVALSGACPTVEVTVAVDGLVLAVWRYSQADNHAIRSLRLPAALRQAGNAPIEIGFSARALAAAGPGAGDEAPGFELIRLRWRGLADSA